MPPARLALALGFETRFSVAFAVHAGAMQVCPTLGRWRRFVSITTHVVNPTTAAGMNGGL
jgi:hypothetical protein